MNLQSILKTLAHFKNSPSTWEVSVPIALVLAVHFSHPYLWALPLIGYFLALLIPKNQAPQSQRVHFLLAYSTVMLWGYWAVIPNLLVAGFLEFWFDVKYEPDPIVWGGIYDFSAYLAGTLVALLGILL